MAVANRIRSPELFAADILKGYSGGIPVNLEAIAASLQARIHDKDVLDGASGYLIRDKRDILIVVSKTDPYVRQRFTIAHEIGHLVMHPGRPLLVDTELRINSRSAGEYATNREEVEANQFAAALLMPEDHITREFQKAKSADAADVLAGKFHVSQSAMQFRLINLGLILP